ncbi:MAG TPA: alpha/beta hydrolase [Longimicrobiales bacterium]|nr:alpha/beta hydrolase [Longimicrobiales bacterium]
MTIFRIALAGVMAGLAAVPLTAQQPDIAGTWAGEIAVSGTRLPLVFHITATDGTLAATMDSPAQGAAGIPVDTVRFAAGVLIMRLVAINGGYTGRLTGEGHFEGEWQQGGMALPLELRRTEAGAVALPRPQHPEPPFPYQAMDIQFPNNAAGLELAGTLTLPPGTGPFPAVVLVSGSGPQDRDETVFGHRPFLVLADHLTRHGVAVLRFDDRGVGESGGDFAVGTTLDFAGDAAAAIRYLRSRPEIAGDRIGVIGHSEGGLIAPLVATGAAGLPATDLAFVVLLAGPGLPGGEILRSQLAAISSAAGMPADRVSDALEVQARMLRIVEAEDDPTRRRARIVELLGTALDAMTPADRALQGIPPGQEQQWMEAQATAVSTPWFRQFLQLDPRPVLGRLQVPTLALFGGLDLQVPAEPNAEAMRTALAAAGNPDYTVRVMPGLNHLFQTARTGLPGEYITIEETFAPAALTAVSGWILERFGAPVLKR